MHGLNPIHVSNSPLFIGYNFHYIERRNFAFEITLMWVLKNAVFFIDWVLPPNKLTIYYFKMKSRETNRLDYPTVTSTPRGLTNISSFGGRSTRLVLIFAFLPSFWKRNLPYATNHVSGYSVRGLYKLYLIPKMKPRTVLPCCLAISN